jgi:pilus assembly protein CpaF
MALDFGPLKTLISSEDISEVMINSWNKIFVEHKGLLVETSAKFFDERQFEELIYSILSEDKKNIADSFCFDGVISKLGYRYNITLPPMSPRGPCLTIRKFNNKNFTLENLINSDFINTQAAKFLKAAVQSRLSIVISGGTGSGKTSFLNTLSSLISHEERIVSIEDVAELRIQHPNWVALQTVRSTNKNITAKDCLVNSLRMRPDRIIMGECRKDETFEMLQAMNTGHDGSMTTIHGNTSIDCLSRIESLVQFCGVDLPLKQIRYQMSQAIDLIVQIRRNSTGKREVFEITELTGMNLDTISRSNIFERDKSGNLISTKYVPNALEKINRESIVLPASFFSNTQITKKAS